MQLNKRNFIWGLSYDRPERLKQTNAIRPFPRSLPSSELLCHLEKLWKTTAIFAVLKLDGACGGQAHWRIVCETRHVWFQISTPVRRWWCHFPFGNLTEKSFSPGHNSLVQVLLAIATCPNQDLQQGLATVGIGMLAVGTPRAAIIFSLLGKISTPTLSTMRMHSVSFPDCFRRHMFLPLLGSRV